MRGLSSVTGWLRGLTLAAVPLTISACGITDPDCTAISQSAVDVRVQNSATGNPIAGALVVVSESSFADSAFTQDEGVLETFLAPDRAGVYELTVGKSGFDLWSRSDVKITLNECGQANTKFFSVELEPQ